MRLPLALVALCLAAVAACGAPGVDRAAAQKLVFLGFDGMDPDLVRKYAAEGKLPV